MLAKRPSLDIGKALEVLSLTEEQLTASRVRIDNSLQECMHQQVVHVLVGNPTNIHTYKDSQTSLSGLSALDLELVYILKKWECLLTALEES